MAQPTADQGADAMRDDAVARVHTAVRASLRSRDGVVLAVSGGRDSMVLLAAAAAVAPERVRRVATFDHRTGPDATRATRLVRDVAERLGFEVSVGAAERPGRSEAEWRAARWRFLRAASGPEGSLPIATAHTADDQLETVFMRALRGAGARGLAGLYAAGPIVRPMLGLSRATVAVYAAARGVPFVDDPSNQSRRFLRNRVRLDALPAAARVQPGFGAELLAIAARAAEWRDGVEALVATLGGVSEDGTELRVPLHALAGLGEDGLGVVWPALAARVGVTLDRRGTRRLSRFTTTSRTGGAMPLSGGATVGRMRDGFVLRRVPVNIASEVLDADAGGVQPFGDGVVCGAFRFRRVGSDAKRTGPAGDGLWTAEFDADVRLTVRAWGVGDRMQLRPGDRPRRVKRFFADSGVPAPVRGGWPVVLAGDAIAWIPGVRRSGAATVRPGRSGVRYECERNHG